MRGIVATSRVDGSGKWPSHTLFAILITLGGAVAAHAQPGNSEEAGAGVRLQYDNRSGATCPDRAVLTRDVVARLGYDPFLAKENASGDLLVVTVLGEKKHLRGEVRWGAGARRGGEVRTIQSVSGDCGELVQALALTISIVIDPLKATDLQEPPTPGEEPPASPKPFPTAPAPESSSAPIHPEHVEGPSLAASAPSAPVSASVPSPERAGRRPLPSKAPTIPESSWRLLLGMHGTVGLLPAVTAGAVVGVELALESVTISLSGRVDAPAEADRPPGKVAASTVFGTAAICGRLSRASLCGFGRIGRLQGAGNGFSANGSGASLIGTAGVGAGYDVVQDQPLRLRLYLDGDVPVTRASLNVDGVPRWTVAPIAGTLGVAMLTSIP